MKSFLIGACFMVASVVVCRATQPECTGDRHYDGVACCPATVTTTTLQGDDNDSCVCPQCPDVVCGSGDTTTTYNVTVNRCPSIPAPAVYAPCRERKNGVARDGDTIYKGKAYKCPRNATPRRFFVPVRP